MSYADAKRALLARKFGQLGIILDSDSLIIDKVDDEGNTLLHIAVQQKSMEAVKFLLKGHGHGSYGWDLTKKNGQGQTALLMALESSQKLLAKEIVGAVIARSLAADFLQLEQIEEVRDKLRAKLEYIDIEDEFLRIQIEHLEKYLKGEYTSPLETANRYYKAVSFKAAELCEMYKGMVSRKASSDLGEERSSNPQCQLKEFKEKIEHQINRSLVPDFSPESEASYYWDKERLVALVELYKNQSCENDADHYDRLLQGRDELELEQRVLIEKYEKEKPLLVQETDRAIEAAEPQVSANMGASSANSGGSLEYQSRHSYKKLSQKVILFLLNAGFPVDMPDASGNTLLHWSVLFKDTDSILLLTDFPWRASLSVVNGLGQTPMSLALAEARTTETLRNRSFEYLGFEAIVEKSVDKLRVVTNGNRYLDVGDENGNTYLHLAARLVVEEGAPIDLVRVLVQNGAKRTELNVFNQTPLEFAGERAADNAEIVELLQPSDAQCAAFRLMEDEDPNTEALKQLFSNGLCVDVRNDFGQTLLHVAAEKEARKIITLLIDEGANPWITNQSGTTAYDVLKEKNPALLMLIEKRASQDTLFWAAKMGQIALVEDILKNYPELLDQQDAEGRTPLFYSMLYSQLHVSQLLLKKGADYLIDDMQGRTPVHAAIQAGNNELARMLDARWSKDVRDKIKDYEKNSDFSSELKGELQRLFSLEYNFKDGSDHGKSWKLFCYLDLRGLSLSARTLYKIFRILGKTKGITHLNASGQHHVLGRFTMPAFSESKDINVFDALSRVVGSKTTTIVSLDLSWVGLNGTHKEILSKLIKSKKISFLNVRYNYLSNRDMKDLLEVYRKKNIPFINLRFDRNAKVSWRTFDTYTGICDEKRALEFQEAEREYAATVNNYWGHPVAGSIFNNAIQPTNQEENSIFNDMSDKFIDGVESEIEDQTSKESMIADHEDISSESDTDLELDEDNLWEAFILKALQHSAHMNEEQASNNQRADQGQVEGTSVIGENIEADEKDEIETYEVEEEAKDEVEEEEKEDKDEIEIKEEVSHGIEVDERDEVEVEKEDKDEIEIKEEVSHGIEVDERGEVEEEKEEKDETEIKEEVSHGIEVDEKGKNEVDAGNFAEYRRELGELLEKLKTIDRYNGKRDWSDEDLTGDYIIDQLYKVLADRVQLIDPGAFFGKSLVSKKEDECQRGTFELVWTLIGGELNQLSDGSLSKHPGCYNLGSNIDKPVIVPIPESTQYLEEGTGSSRASSSLPSELSCEHWILMVILPKQYTMLSGVPLNNEKPQLFLIDSINLRRKLSRPVIKLLVEGGQITEQLENNNMITRQVSALFSEIEFVENASVDRQQKIRTRDCGAFVLYNALMICLTGSTDFLAHDKDRKIASALRAIFPVNPDIKAQYQENRGGSQILRYEGFDDQHSGDEASVEFPVPPVPLVPYNVKESVSSMKEECFIFDRFLDFGDYLIELCTGEEPSETRSESFAERNNVNIVALHHFFHTMAQKIKELQNEFREKCPSAVIDPAKFPQNEFSYRAALLRVYEELMGDALRRNPEFNHHALVLHLNYLICINIAELCRKSSSFSKLQAGEEKYFPRKIKKQFQKEVRVVFNDVKDEMLTKYRSNRSYNTVRKKSSFGSPRSPIKRGIASMINMNSFSTPHLSNLLGAKVAPRFYGKARIEHQEPQRVVAINKRCKEESTRLSMDEIKTLSEKMFTLDDINYMATLLRRGVGEVRIYMTGLHEALSISEQDPNETRLLQIFLEKLVARLSDIYEEQLMLLDTVSLGVFSKFIAYHILDFCAICGNDIKEMPMNVLMKSMLHWVCYGKFRESIDLVTRTGNITDCYTLLNKCGLKFIDGSDEIMRLNVTLPDRPRQQGERWGCRMATFEEKAIVTELANCDNPSYGEIASLCFSHTENDDLMPMPEGMEIFESFEFKKDAKSLKAIAAEDDAKRQAMIAV